VVGRDLGCVAKGRNDGLVWFGPLGLEVYDAYALALGECSVTGPGIAVFDG